MVLCLLIGDSHLPYRAKEISEIILNELDELTTDQLFDYTFFTGDVIKAPEFINFLNRRTEKNLFAVVGNMDYYYGNRNAPIYQEQNILFDNNDKLSIGLTHGAQIRPRGDHYQLEKLAIEKGINILISGHTHKEEVFLTTEGILLVNPGSITGAWSFLASGIPSFIELSISEETKHLIVNLIQLDKKSGVINEIKSHFIYKNNQIHYKF